MTLMFSVVGWLPVSLVLQTVNNALTVIYCCVNCSLTPMYFYINLTDGKLIQKSVSVLFHLILYLSIFD